MVSGQLRSLVNESPPRPADETRDSSFLGGSGIRAGAESLLTSCPGWASESDDSLDSVDCSPVGLFTHRQFAAVPYHNSDNSHNTDHLMSKLNVGLLSRTC